MAKNTDSSLKNKVIYCVYIRNHTQEGTFKALEADLDRIRNLGTDIIWLMPVNPIGKKNKKGSLGCPYSVQNYREVNPEYGTMDEFKHLVSKIHSSGMKCIIDIVYNHTSRDSWLSINKPEYFYKNENGDMGNRIGEWTDVYDLNYSNKELWDYQIDTLKMWLKIVDGFRCDVASMVPVEFWERARKECAEVKGNVIWLAESVHSVMIHGVREEGIPIWSDNELYSAFDITYDYDIWSFYENYLNGSITLREYADILNYQDIIYPCNYIKMRCLENHDQPRIASRKLNKDAVINWTAFSYFEKGITLIYAGQEFYNTKTPSLFEKDVVERNDKADLSSLMQRMCKLKKDEIFEKGSYSLKDTGCDVIQGKYVYKGREMYGFFSLKGRAGKVNVSLQDGVYRNEIDGEEVSVVDGKMDTKVMPAVIFI